MTTNFCHVCSGLAGTDIARTFELDSSLQSCRYICHLSTHCFLSNDIKDLHLLEPSVPASSVMPLYCEYLLNAWTPKGHLYLELFLGEVEGT